MIYHSDLGELSHLAFVAEIPPSREGTAMSTAAHAPTGNSGGRLRREVSEYLGGLLGGLVGGIAFGIVMHFTGIVLMVARLIDRDTATVGWAIHLAISLLFGLLFAVIFRKLARTTPAAILAGLGYGYLWWVLGALIIMPTWLGADEMIFQLTTTAWESLGGHLLYGTLLGLTYGLVLQHRRVSEG